MKATRTPDLTGRRYGSVVVTSRAGSNSAGNATWWCHCDCGNDTRSSGTDLRRGRTKTCGCGSAAVTRARHDASRDDFVGRRFGRYVVIAYAGLNSYPRATWLCACDCGTTKVVTGHHLIGGDTVSCGCHGRQAVSEARKADLREVIGYAAAHGRVKTLHGPASDHLCVDCLTPAQDWSYDHGDAAERTDPRGRPYSQDPAHYWPRCRSCHKSFDLAANRATSGDAQEGARA